MDLCHVCLDTLCVYMVLDSCKPNTICFYYYNCIMNNVVSPKSYPNRWCYGKPSSDHSANIGGSGQDTTTGTKTQRQRCCRPHHRRTECQVDVLIPISTLDHMPHRCCCLHHHCQIERPTDVDVSTIAIRWYVHLASMSRPSPPDGTPIWR